MLQGAHPGHSHYRPHAKYRPAHSSKHICTSLSLGYIWASVEGSVPGLDTGKSRNTLWFTSMPTLAPLFPAYERWGLIGADPGGRVLLRPFLHYPGCGPVHRERTPLHWPGVYSKRACVCAYVYPHTCVMCTNALRPCTYMCAAVSPCGGAGVYVWVYAWVCVVGSRQGHN